MPRVAFATVKTEVRRRSNVEEMNFFGECAFGDFFQRRQIVEDPNRASMGRQHKRIVARLNLDIVNAHQRQVPFHSSPVAPAIERHVRAELSSEKQKVLIARVLADHVTRHARG